MGLEASEDFKRGEASKKSQVKVEHKTLKIEPCDNAGEECVKVEQTNETSQDRSVEKDMHISTIRKTVSFLETLSVEEQLVQVFTEQVRSISSC
jgi:hypothetical protein